MSMSNYLENELVDLIFRARTWSPPAQLYVSLHSADPVETGANELAHSNGYERATPGASAYNVWKGTGGEVTAVDSAGTDGQTKNNVEITYPVCTSSAWTQATHFGVWDSGTYGAGNFLFGGSLGTPKTVQVGDVASFAADSLTVTWD